MNHCPAEPAHVCCSYPKSMVNDDPRDKIAIISRKAHDRQALLIKVNYRIAYAWQKIEMRLRCSELLQIAAAAAFIIAAWLVPSVASAHAGHRDDGASTVVSSSHQTSCHQTSVVPNQTVKQVAVSETVVEVTAAAFPGASGWSECAPFYCSTGCAAAGAGCCASALAGEFGGFILPISLAVVTVWADEPARLGAILYAVHRPPKSF